MNVGDVDTSHLATALELDSEDEAVHLLTEDARMRQVGAELGLRAV